MFKIYIYWHQCSKFQSSHFFGPGTTFCALYIRVWPGKVWMTSALGLVWFAEWVVDNQSDLVAKKHRRAIVSHLWHTLCSVLWTLQCTVLCTGTVHTVNTAPEYILCTVLYQSIYCSAQFSQHQTTLLAVGHRTEHQLLFDFREALLLSLLSKHLKGRIGSLFVGPPHVYYFLQHPSSANITPFLMLLLPSLLSSLAPQKGS